MRTVFIILVIIIILGGGWYWYTTQQDITVDDTSGDMSGMDDLNTTSDTSTNTGTSTGGTQIGIDGSVNVSTGTVKEFTVTGSNFRFAPATLTVKKGDTVKITFKNSGGMHDFVIDEFNARTKQIQGGAQETITFVADKAGSFEYYCSVGNHRAMGMKGTLTVTE